MASPALLDDGLSSQCLLRTPQLRCQRLAVSTAAGANTSRLVCAASDGQERATDMYAALVALSVLIVPVAALLNLAVVVTVYMNRRLHTVINVLVTVLCMNNVMWTGMPILCVLAVNFSAPWHCTLRYFFFVSTRHICFSVIVIITVLRYLLVVKNRAFPADSRNAVTFIAFAVMPSLIKFYFRSARDHAKCRKALAWSPDGYAIYGLFKEPIDWISATVISTEYMSGLAIIAVCYLRILMKILRSKQRLRARRRVPMELPQQRQPKIAVVEEERAENGQQQEQQQQQQQPGGPGENAPGGAKSVSLSAFMPAARARVSGQTWQPAPPRAGPSQLDPGAAQFADTEGATLPPLKKPIQPRELTTTAEVEASTSAAGSDVRDAKRSPAPSMIVTEPSNLLKVSSPKLKTGQASTSDSESRRGVAPRKPAQPAARVDIVATVSMTAFIMIFFVVISPLWTLELVNNTAECVILPTMRIFLYIILIVTGGSAAIVSPFVLVLFSGDFRRALKVTIRRLAFLMLKAQSGQSAELLDDVRASRVPDSAGRRLYLLHPHVTEVVDFVSHHLHFFSRSPNLVLQQAMNEPADSWLRSSAEQLVRESQPPGTALVRLSCQPRRSVNEPRPCQMTLRPAEAVTAATVDPAGERLYVGLPSGEVKLYDLTSGRETRTFTGHGEPITSLALLAEGIYLASLALIAEGAYLASGAADGQLSVWEAGSGRRLAVTRAHRRRVACLTVQPDGGEFVSVGWSCDIKLWRFRASAGLGSSSGGGGGGELQEVRTLERGARPITCAAFHPSRPLVATGGWDGAVKIWDTTEMKRKAVRHGHDSSVRCLAISPDASYLVSGDLDGYLIVWGTKHGDWIQKSRVHDGPIQAACYLGPEKFVTAGADGDVKMWRSHVGSDIHQAASSAPVQLALAAPNGSLLTVTTGGEISLQPVAPPTSGDAGTAGRGGPPRWSRRLENVSRAACDQHRVYLAVGRAVLVLKMSDGKTERQLAAGAPVTSLACLPPEAPDSAMGVVLMGLEDGRVGVALADRGELVTTVAHAGEVTDIAVNVHDPERPRMATGGRDGMVLLWSGEDSWDKPYRSLEAYSVPVSALAWIDDQLVTAGQDSQMHLYPRPDDPAGERRLLVGNDAPVTALRAH
ncbi:Vegetative incompatibility protein HET-E-1 [Amphibalanus amphitrite]|uniref:Vegetative incompatibility protein HET-E-1 n=1 Tax=Amphibalanus amphitrite TaxID=1232801 RepID=A0A6A4V9E7_AMPAM|nr:Vegetative incompatibility protein HET-E-1 [Amphibalanus amphitrite]